MNVDDRKATATVNQHLAASGLRRTPQRQQVYKALVAHPDHPTAEQLFLRIKQTTPKISLATVYNCLDALIACGLVRQVAVDRGAARFCANMDEHFHFHCESCNSITDMPLKGAALARKLGLPRGFQARRLDMTVHGTCRTCSARVRA
jgi:Fur family peroxide stress response transcriptional regulator